MTTNSVVDRTVRNIERDVEENSGLDAIREELDKHRGDMGKKEFSKFLDDVENQLHKDGILPVVDLVATENGHAALLGISGDGKIDGKGGFVTREDGRSYKYDDNGHIIQYSEGDGSGVWKYDEKDGQYHQFKNGEATGEMNSDIRVVNQNGQEIVMHQDGSTTMTTRWGNTVERNAEGQITQTTRDGLIRTFEYDDQGKLIGMTDFASKQDQQSNNPQESYSIDEQSGKFFAASDTTHQDPLDIKVVDGDKLQGVVEIRHGDGSLEQQRLGGTVVNWNTSGELTSIDYKNGNKAELTYDDNHNLVGMTMTGKDGAGHTYETKNGKLSVDGGEPTKGAIEYDEFGRITVTQGDPSDKDYQSTLFRMGGAQVESGQHGVTRVVDLDGNEHTFGYNDKGELNKVNAFGQDLRLKDNQWVDAQGNPVNFTPKVRDHGALILTKDDGTFDAYTPGGLKIQGQREPGASDSETFDGMNFDMDMEEGAWGGFSNGKIPNSAMEKVYGMYVAPDVADNLRELLNAADEAGVWHPGQPFATGTYRPYSVQVSLWNQHQNGSHPAPVAEPGTSMHGWGQAIDFTMDNQRLINWLADNAQRFGFQNLEGEPWHYSTNGN